MTDRPTSLLFLSDIHLGSDLHEHAGGVGGVRRSRKSDEDLVALLHYYADHPPPGGDWRLIIVGDLIDFVGMTLPTDSSPLDAPNDEESAHGLGNTERHSVTKMRRVAERHAPFFAALASFLERGNSLVVMRGNHDLELHWPAVKAEFRATLARLSAGVEARVEFRDWFYFLEGVVYAEHGDRYDTLAMTHHGLAPLDPRDTRRTERSLSDILVRFVVRQTPGMREYGHEGLGVRDYVGFGYRLGVGGAGKLFTHYIGSILETLRVQRASSSPAAAAVGEEHERRLREYAETSATPLERLRALEALQAKPVTSSARGVLAGTMFDRVGLTVISAIATAAFAAFARSSKGARVGLVVTPALWYLALRAISADFDIDPARVMLSRARPIAGLFAAPFIVMGHTHTPVRVPVGEDATYLNLGTWLEEDDERGPAGPRAPRTHAVVRVAREGVSGELLAWDSAQARPVGYGPAPAATAPRADAPAAV